MGTSKPATWLAKAKKRAEESAPDAPWSIEKAIPFLDPLERIAWGDAPHAYALLERAIAEIEDCICGTDKEYDERQALLRDLEGEEETDAGTDT
jgi:hypothetical protein